MKRLRELARSALPHARDVPDPLPAELRHRERLPLKADALAALHFPRDVAEGEEARERLAFDELLVLQLGILRRKAEAEDAVATALGEPGELVARYRLALPFELTEHQERAIAEIDLDLRRTAPMQRLLQGDVGSGKTVVALYALLRAVESGAQGALMAPTETLAEQHFLTIEGICAELGVSCVLVTSATPPVTRDLLRSGEAQIAVGTHALIQEGVEFADLAVAVVDEQHRFGVEQRKALATGRTPHVLHMTATPIPRTLALTVYGDLSVSEIAKPPASRRPIVTAWVTAERSSDAYKRLRRASRRRAPGLRRLPADRGDGDLACTRRRGGGRPPPAGRAEGLPRRAAPRPAPAGRAPRADGELQGARARRPRRDDGDRGRDRRPERDDHDRPGGRPFRPRAAAPAPRARRPRRGAVVLPADLAAARRAHRRREGAARGARRLDGRVRARREGPGDPRRRAAARHAAGGPLRSALHAPDRRPRVAGAALRWIPRPARRRGGVVPSTGRH